MLLFYNAGICWATADKSPDKVTHELPAFELLLQYGLSHIMLAVKLKKNFFFLFITCICQKNLSGKTFADEA